MRPIKFRAWDIYSDHWKYFVIGESFGTIGESLYKSFCLEGSRFYQFTGLTDKNGKEIYEGDIVKTSTDKAMVISWSERFASFVIDRDGWAFQHWFGEAFEGKDCEVIGNIHENPNLL